MKAKVFWVIAVILVVLVLFAMPFLFRFGGLGWGWHVGMMGGRGGMGHPFGFFPFGFFGMGLMLLLPIALLILLVLGGVALVNSLTRPGGSISQPAQAVGRPARIAARPSNRTGTTAPTAAPRSNENLDTILDNTELGHQPVQQLSQMIDREGQGVPAEKPESFHSNLPRSSGSIRSPSEHAPPS